MTARLSRFRYFKWGGEPDSFQPDFSFEMWAAFALLGEGSEQSPQSTFGVSQPSAKAMFGGAVWPKSRVEAGQALPC